MASSACCLVVSRSFWDINPEPPEDRKTSMVSFSEETLGLLLRKNLKGTAPLKQPSFKGWVDFRHLKGIEILPTPVLTPPKDSNSGFMLEVYLSA